MGIYVYINMAYIYVYINMTLYSRTPQLIWK